VYSRTHRKEQIIPTTELIATCVLATIVWLLPDTLFEFVALLILGAFIYVSALASIALYIKAFEGLVIIDRPPYLTFNDVAILYCANVFLYTGHYTLLILTLLIFTVQMLKLLESRKEDHSD